MSRNTSSQPSDAAHKMHRAFGRCFCALALLALSAVPALAQLGTQSDGDTFGQLPASVKGDPVGAIFTGKDGLVASTCGYVGYVGASISIICLCWALWLVFKGWRGMDGGAIRLAAGYLLIGSLLAKPTAIFNIIYNGRPGPHQYWAACGGYKASKGF